MLAQQAAAAARPGDIVVELCCGSGAVSAAVAAAVPDLELYALDLDPAAVRCARRNLGDRVRQSDLYESLPAELRGRVAVLIANAPYVPTNALSTMPQEARLYEPRLALDGGSDGLDVLRRVIAGAPAWLAPGGQVLVEASQAQAEWLADAIIEAGLRPRVISSRQAAFVAVVIGE